jgi:hypothetical protein
MPPTFTFHAEEGLPDNVVEDQYEDRKLLKTRSSAELERL